MFGQKRSNKSTTRGQHSFAQVPDVSQPRSSFRRNCGLKTTFDAGDLIPIFSEEVLPGDTIKLSMSHVARLATPIKPIMDNMWLDIFWFFIPNRLVWFSWVTFMGEETDPGEASTKLIPQSVSPDPGGYLTGSLQDYFGLPIEAPGLSHSSLALRGYLVVFDQWFRDENLVDKKVPAGLLLGDGPDLSTVFTIQTRGKRHDYFTSCLPFPQKGTAVQIGVGATAPVVFDPLTAGTPKFKDAGSPGTGGRVLTFDDTLHPSSDPRVELLGPGPDGPETLYWGDTHLIADLSAATAISVNTLRSSTAIQRLLEKDARGGTRYTELVRAHFGVVSPDARLQRPEYLGGGSHLIQMSTVPQTGQTATTAQGNLAAFGVSTSSGGSGFVQSFTEHGFILGLVSARADLNYQQGLHRQWSRSTRIDHYFPTLAHLGEQAVLNKEIFAQGTDDATADAAVFGYQERWAEYRYKASQITGVMRSAAPSALDVWHLAQDFATLPVLNETFIKENPPVDRVIATPAEPHFLLDAYFDFVHVRPMPVYSVPALTDRF